MKNVLIYAMGAVLVFFVVKAEIDRRSYNSEIVELHNQLAEAAKTIEIKDNLFMKKTIEVEDLKSVISSWEHVNEIDKKTIKELANLLKAKQEELLTANRLAIKWKKAYEAQVEGRQDDVPGEGDVKRTKVSFSKDFGYIGVEGYTLTDPPQAYVKVQQNRPLMLSLALTQDRKGVWKTYVTSSESDVGVDVVVSAVNPYLLKDKWYEKLSLTTSLAGDSDAFMASFGVSYDFGSFVLGPSVFALYSDRVSVAYGANLSWKPFKR